MAFSPAARAGSQDDSAVLARFTAAVQQYVGLQQKVREEVPPLVPNSDPQTIIRASDMLAAAIQRARPQAHQGDFFSPEVRKVFQARIARALNHADFLALTGADDPEERSSIASLRTYARYPVNGPLATMPPSILQALPALPEELEYRFIGRDLILRDRQARLVLDYIRIELPAR